MLGQVVLPIPTPAHQTEMYIVASLLLHQIAELPFQIQITALQLHTDRVLFTVLAAIRNISNNGLIAMYC